MQGNCPIIYKKNKIMKKSTHLTKWKDFASQNGKI